MLVFQYKFQVLTFFNLKYLQSRFFIQQPIILSPTRGRAPVFKVFISSCFSDRSLQFTLPLAQVSTQQLPIRIAGNSVKVLSLLVNSHIAFSGAHASMFFIASCNFIAFKMLECYHLLYSMKSTVNDKISKAIFKTFTVMFLRQLHKRNHQECISGVIINVSECHGFCLIILSVSTFTKLLNF